MWVVSVHSVSRGTTESSRLVTATRATVSKSGTGDVKEAPYRSSRPSAPWSRKGTLHTDNDLHGNLVLETGLLLPPALQKPLNYNLPSQVNNHLTSRKVL